jgi:methionyl aminopeptidase
MAAEVAKTDFTKCANPECGKESGKLICPQCKETKKPLNVASFCSQECFKTFWPIHKLTHDFPKDAKAKVDSTKKSTIA